MNKNLLRIAFADDDPDDHLFFFDAIKSIYRLALINNFFYSNELLDFFSRKKNIAPHIMFLDKNMAGNENYQCLELIRKDPVFVSVPVIIYSTSANPIEMDDALKKGATSFITKPSTQTETIDVLRSTINKFVPVKFEERHVTVNVSL
jgi:CheY-like chemotaxis protein